MYNKGQSYNYENMHTENVWRLFAFSEQIGKLYSTTVNNNKG